MCVTILKQDLKDLVDPEFSINPIKCGGFPLQLHTELATLLHGIPGETSTLVAQVHVAGSKMEAKAYPSPHKKESQ